MTDENSTTPDETRKGRSTKRIVAIGSGVLAVALAAGYVGTAAAVTRTAPDGTTIGNTDVSGMTEQEAARAAKEDAKKAPGVVVNAGGKTIELDAAKAGLTLDASKAADGLTGFSLSPSVVLDHLRGKKQNVELPAKVDKAALRTALAEKSSVFDGAPKNGTVKYIAGKVEVTRSTPGTGLDVKAVADQVAAGWPKKTTFEATLGKTDAQVTNAEIDRYVKDVANPAMKGNVTVKAGDKTASLAPAQISEVISTENKDGKLALAVDEKKFNALLKDFEVVLVTPPKNAKLSDKGKITPAVDGEELVFEGTGPALVKALGSQERTVELKTKKVKAKIQAEQLKAAAASSSGAPSAAPSDGGGDGEKQVQLRNQLLSEFSIHLPGGAANQARTSNIQKAMAKVNGTVLAPGETFSLLGAVAPITKANGYLDAPVIVNGVEEMGTGGGISQVSSTLYNAAFFAGLKIDEWTPHHFWISRYPMGRESTLWVPTIDLKFTNDTGHPIRIEAGAGAPGTQSWAKFYGTKVFEVTSTTGPRFDIRPGGTHESTADPCVPQPRQEGFKVTVTRVVKRGGEVVKNESKTTTYEPADQVTC